MNLDPKKHHRAFDTIMLIATGLALMLIALLLITLGGCGATAYSEAPSVTAGAETLAYPTFDTTKTVTCEGDCPPDLSEAEAKWETATGLTYFIESGTQHITVSLGEIPPGVTGCGVATQYHDGSGRCDVVIDPVCWGDVDVVAHELGHCLGLGHSSDPTSVMYPYAGSEVTDDARSLLISNFEK